jgi:hypothetical protein
MAPMIGAMGDNVDNYLGVDALPPFDLFPWFFVAPGVLLVVLGAVHVRRQPSRSGETAISQETVTSTQGES